MHDDARWTACARALALGLLAAPAFVLAASFPCDKAGTRVEKAICSATEVSDLDEYLGRYYAAARVALRPAEACLVADQRSWLQTVRDACADTACLQRVYLDRLATLHALQPGVTSLRNVALPKVPALVWIVPPAQDQVAAPRTLPSVPLVARGRIVNEVGGGDGLVLRTDAGATHLIVPLMFLEQRTTEALDGLAREPQARFELRGRTATNDVAPKAFSSGHCTYVYRTVP